MDRDIPDDKEMNPASKKTIDREIEEYLERKGIKPISKATIRLIGKK